MYRKPPEFYFHTRKINWTLTHAWAFGLLVWKVPGGTAVLNLLIAHATFLWPGINKSMMSQDTETKDLEIDLKRFMELHDIPSVEDILQLNASDLLKMDGFGYRLLNYITGLKK